MVMAGITKADFTKQTAHIDTFKVGSSHPKHKKQSPKQAPKQQIHSTNFQSQSESAFAQSQMASQQSEQQQQTPNAMPFKNCNKKAFQRPTPIQLFSSKLSPAKTVLQAV